MSFTFDGPNKLIICDPGVVSFSVAEIYSRWKEWTQESDNLKYVPAFSESVGGNPLGNGVFLGAYYFLQNGWLIRPQEANHVLSIDGNLFAIPDTAPIFASTIGAFNVQIGLNTSSLTQQVQIPATNSPASIAQAVWQEDLSGAQVQDTAGDVVKKTKGNSAAAVALSA